ncbi:Rid family hydrolase [Streptomyces sp. 7-21]|jgi:enamine deaminase RidA (YjgF/YER057c/UK114 family)|uniref:Rid family hydrolase n=1 Tax=Streptomyces sp. 7-21 TaxID=2802283 RepID=UPI00191F2457|nr:Rid family hydrolase [Streptomyces sp. 7-21]MBL1066808.1 RidA family protein [Streptomyces sp. 7-21]
MTIERVRTGASPWQESIGSARAVAAGDLVLVAGTMPPAAGAAATGDPYEQARAAFADAVAALGPFGLGVESVIRTRVYLSHGRDAEEVVRAHKDVFGETGPVATLVVVAGFADSRVLVQVELEAYRGTAAQRGEP